MSPKSMKWVHKFFLRLPYKPHLKNKYTIENTQTGYIIDPPNESFITFSFIPTWVPNDTNTLEL